GAVQEARVVMVSALRKEGAEVTLRARDLGAVDFLPKPQKNQLSEMRASRDLLVGKVLAAAQTRVRRARRVGTAPRAPQRPSPGPATARPAGRPAAAPHASVACVVIGISTGGPQALSPVL